MGFDPYYPTHKAEMLGYHPEVIFAGRRINDGMGKFIAGETVKLMIRNGSNIRGTRVNVLGLTFKENCPDVRNSKEPDIVWELESYGLQVAVSDPEADSLEAFEEYGIRLVADGDMQPAEAVIVAVAHAAYTRLTPSDMVRYVTPGAVVVDVKAALVWPSHAYSIWRL